MTSRRQNVYTWIWLAVETQPIEAGVIEKADGVLSFTYGKSYLGNPKAISIFSPEIPLSMERIMPMAGLEMANCIRDCSPDAWGRRVILNRIGALVKTLIVDRNALIAVIQDQISFLGVAANSKASGAPLVVLKSTLSRSLKLATISWVATDILALPWLQPENQYI